MLNRPEERRVSKWERKRVTPEAQKVGPERWRGPARLRRDRSVQVVSCVMSGAATAVACSGGRNVFSYSGRNVFITPL